MLERLVFAIGHPIQVLPKNQRARVDSSIFTHPGKNGNDANRRRPTSRDADHLHLQTIATRTGQSRTLAATACPINRSAPCYEFSGQVSSFHQPQHAPLQVLASSRQVETIASAAWIQLVEGNTCTRPPQHFPVYLFAEGWHPSTLMWSKHAGDIELSRAIVLST